MSKNRQISGVDLMFISSHSWRLKGGRKRVGGGGLYLPFTEDLNETHLREKTTCPSLILRRAQPEFGVELSIL